MNRSNNNILFDCVETLITRKVTAETFYNVAAFVHDYQINNGKEVNYNFSHDNWLGVLCWLHFTRNNKAVFPLLGHHMLHPIRAIQFMWMRFPTILFWLYPIVILFSVLEATIFARKTKEGKLHTSGILLDSYVIMAYDCYLWDIILTWIVGLRKDWGTWDNIYRIYHGNPSHYNYKIYVAYMNNRGGR